VRCIVEFEITGSCLRLPLAYNSLVQALIYRHLDRALASWLHEKGTPLGKRQFRFFSFSRLLGRYRIDNGKIEFSGPVKFYIGSVHEEILQSLVEHLLQDPEVHLGDNLCEIRGIEVEPLPKLSRPMRVRTLSPITTYSTLKTAEGKKKTCLLYTSPSPRDQRGSRMPSSA